MLDPEKWLANRAASYLRCDHGDGLNHASFDVEALLRAYGADLLLDVADKFMLRYANGGDASWLYAADKLRREAKKE